MAVLYVVQELFRSTRDREDFIRILGAQTRFTVQLTDGLSAVAVGSLVATDLPYESARRVAQDYIVLSANAVFAAVSEDAARFGPDHFVLPTRAGYYYSIVLGGAQLLVSGFGPARQKEALQLCLLGRSLGAIIYRTDVLEDLLTQLREAGPTQAPKTVLIAVPSAEKALRFLEKLAGRLSGSRTDQLSADDFRLVARSLVTEDLFQRLKATRDSPRMQQALLAHDRAVPILYKTPIGLLGPLDPVTQAGLALTGAAVLDGTPKGRLHTFFAPAGHQRVYATNFGSRHSIPRIFGQYEGGLFEHLAQRLLLPEPDFSTIVPRMPTSSTLAGNQLSFMLSTLSGAEAPEHMIGEQLRQNSYKFTTLYFYCEEIVDGLVSLTLGYHYTAKSRMQTASNDIFKRNSKSPETFWGASYLALRHYKGIYNEVLALLRARPIVCTFYALELDKSHPTSAVIALNAAVTSHFQMLASCSSLHEPPAIDSVLMNQLRKILQFPKALADDPGAEEREPELKAQQSECGREIDEVLWRLLTIEQAVNDTLAILLDRAVCFLPFEVLPSLYPFVHQRLFVVVDPSLVLNTEQFLRSLSQCDDGRTLAEELPAAFKKLKQFSDTLRLSPFIPEEYPTRHYTDEFMRDIEGNMPRNYSYSKAITLEYSDLRVPVSLNSHFRSLVWLQLVLETLLCDFLQTVAQSRQAKTPLAAKTPFCAFASLDGQCTVCGSAPAHPDAAALLHQLCQETNTIMELAQVNLERPMRFEHCTEPGYTVWHLLAQVGEDHIDEVSTHLLEGACKRVPGEQQLCKVCVSLCQMFDLPLHSARQQTYRRAVCARILGILLKTLLLVPQNDETLHQVARMTGLPCEKISCIDFVCQPLGKLQGTNDGNISLWAHLPTFLTTLFREHGNYGVALKQALNEYAFMHQNKHMVSSMSSRGMEIPDESRAMEPSIFIEKTCVNGWSGLSEPNEKVLAPGLVFTEPDESYQDPRFQRRS